MEGYSKLRTLPEFVIGVPLGMVRLRGDWDPGSKRVCGGR